MGDGERRPPRPSSPELMELQRQFYREWQADRAEGITPRATFKMLQEHLKSDAEFQGEMLGRVAGLETNAKRDAEDRTHEAITGSHNIPPPPPKMPSFRPWWGQDPWKTIIKYTAILLIGGVAGAIGHHYAVPVPNPAREALGTKASP